MPKTIDELNVIKSKPKVFVPPPLTKTQKSIIKVMEDKELDIAITLPFKKSFRLNNNKLFQSNSPHIHITSEIAVSWAKKWVNKINQKCYPNGGKSIVLIGSKERKKGGCWHYHVAIKELDIPGFRQMLIDTWNNFCVSQDACISHQSANAGWGAYISKWGGELDLDISRF